MSMESFFDIDTGFGVGMLVYYLLSMLVSFGLSIAVYVFRSLGVYTIAKRRELKNPWMAWVPILDYWMLGSISDQYQYVVKGKNKNKRKWMLGLSIAQGVVMAVFWVVYIVMFVRLIVGAVDGYMSESAMLEQMLGFLGGIVLLLLPLMGVAIALTVLRYIALYDLYNSVDPKNSVLYLVLSILVSISEPFFIFFNRKKDLGMPPRKPRMREYIAQEPAAADVPVYEAEPVPAATYAAEEDFAPAETPAAEPAPVEEPVPAEEPVPVAEPAVEEEPAAAEAPAPTEEAPAESAAEQDPWEV